MTGAVQQGGSFRPVATCDFELAAAAPVVQLPTDMDVADVCVRLHGCPIGVVRMEGPSIHPFEIRSAVADRLAEPLAARIAATRIGLPASPDALTASLDPIENELAQANDDVSIVLCTRDRPADLAGALASLVPAAGAEIIVVDNSSDGAAIAIANRFAGVRAVTEPEPGLDRARNRGLSLATRPIVAFTDDDVRVDAGWVGAIGRFFRRNPDASAMTGLVLPLELETPAQWQFEDYLGFGRGFERRWHLAPGPDPIAATHGNTGRLGTGANMAFRRDALQAVGEFDPALDAGTATGGGGDLEAFFRILKAGGLLGYEPAAVVRHRHRRTARELERQIRSWGTGMGAYMASISLAFPDEAAAVAALHRRLLLTWFPRRWLFSLVRSRYRHPLVRAEIAGLREGRARYTRAQERSPNRPFSRIHPAASPGVGADRALDITEPILPLCDLGAASSVRIRVNRGGLQVGTLVLEAVGGCVGSDRLGDAIARMFPEAVLGEPVDAAVRRLRRMLRTAEAA